MNFTTEKFEECQSACLDTGPQKTVLKEQQAKLYSKHTKTNFTFTKTKDNYKFGYGIHKYQGLVIIKISVSDAMVIQEPVVVISLNVSFLLDLALLDKHKMALGDVHNKLIYYDNLCETPLTRINGCIYLPWPYIHQILTIYK